MADRVLVLGDDVRAFLGVVRSLGRRGLEVHVAPTDGAAPALHSRYIAATQNLPAYATNPAAWEAALRKLIADFDYRMIVPCSDASLVQLQHHSRSFGRDRLALPNPQAFAVFTDKRRTRQLAKSVGVAVAPGQGLTAKDDARDLARRYGFPLLLKPVKSYRLGDPHDKRAVEMLRDVAALEQAMSEEAWRDCLVEGFFAGEGLGVSVVARCGRIVSFYQHRRLQQFTETGVSTSRVSERVDDALRRDVERLAAAVSLDGVAMFEFRRNTQTGEHVLLEVNPRFWGSLPLALAAGADFPAMIYDQLRGGSVAAAPYRAGMVKRDLSGEYERRVIRAEAAAGLSERLYWSAAALLTPVALSRGEADSWAEDDPAPYFAERRELLERIRDAVGKRLRVRSSSRATRAVPGRHRLRSA